MNNKIHLSSLKNIKEFVEISDKWKKNAESLDITKDLSIINWNFLKNIDKTDLNNFINDFSEVLAIHTLKADQSKCLVELIFNHLRSEYESNSIYRKVFISLIWKLYDSNPFLKNDFEFTIKNLFPHHVADEYTIIGYCKALLDLVTPLSVDDELVFPQLKLCADMFIKDIRSFIMSEFIWYVVDLDCLLSKSDLLKSNGNEDKNSLASKLDSILCLVFDWMKASCYTGTKLNWPVTEGLYKCVRQAYFKCILPCNISNSMFHSHYIFAYLTSFYPSLARNTCEYFWTLATDEKQPINIRSSAITNLCAYISKFNFIDIDFLINILTHIFAWCKEYGQYVYESNSADSKHSIFFDMCNGGLYVFLYRHKEIIDQFSSLHEFTVFADDKHWDLMYLIKHPAVVLRQYPFREQLTDIKQLIVKCRLGDIDSVIEKNVFKKVLKQTHLSAMPFRYFFLPNSVKYISPFRVQVRRHECMDQ